MARSPVLRGVGARAGLRVVPAATFLVVAGTRRRGTRQSRLVIVKGDANYRRLLGDARWDLATPFADVTCCFPAPLLALRTLKAELGCGISRSKEIEAKEKHPGDWMTSGTFGCAQLNAAPAGQHAVASLATALPPDASFAGVKGGRVKGEGGEGGGV